MASAARADTHQVCLDLELGPQLFDASPRQPSGDTCAPFIVVDCDPGDMSLVAWEQCDGTPAGNCVPKEPEFGEDYGRWEGDRPFTAMRWLARVKDASSNDVIWGWEPLDGNGCTGLIDVDTTITDVRLEWMRWTVSPEEHSILGYECELSDPGAMPEGPDGACEDLELDEVVLEVGASSSTCGGGTDSVDHCTLHTIVGLDLEPIDYNLWAVTFADSRINFFEPTQAYLLQEQDDGNSTTSSAGPWMGGHPCIRFKSNQWHSKRVAAREYGHLAFFDIPNAQGSHPTAYPGDIDYVDNTHSLGSVEWQAAAAVEGFANLAALATWNDITEDDVVNYVLLVQDGLHAEGVGPGGISPHPIAMPPWNSPATGSLETKWSNLADAYNLYAEAQ